MVYYLHAHRDLGNMDCSADGESVRKTSHWSQALAHSNEIELEGWRVLPPQHRHAF